MFKVQRCYLELETLNFLRVHASFHVLYLLFYKYRKNKMEKSCEIAQIATLIL